MSSDNPQKINDIFYEARRRFIKWVNGKPTGKFSMEINVKDGGVRDKPEYGYKEKG